MAKRAPNPEWKTRWEHKMLHQRKPTGLLGFQMELVKAGYEIEYRIKYDKVGSFLRVDFAHPRTRHVVEIEGKSQSIGVRPACNARRDIKLARAGWLVTRISYEASQKL